MSRRHLIKHYGRYIHRHEDYLAICEGDDCASQILDLFEYWTACRHDEINRIRSYNHVANKVGQPEMRVPDLWLYESIDDFRTGLFQGYGKTYVIKSLKFLKEKGYIKDRDSKLKFDRTREYLFVVATVQEALDQWHRGQNSNPDYLESSFLDSGDNADSVESSKVIHESSEIKQESSEVAHEGLKVDSFYISNNPSNSPSNSPSNLRGGWEEKKEQTRNGGKPPAPNINSVSNQEAIEHIQQSTVIREDKYSAVRDNSIFVGHGNIAPDGKPRVLNQLTGKWQSSSSDPWMNGCNPDRDFKKWVCNQAIAAGKNYSLSDAAGEIRNNFQRASDLWEEYLEDQEKARQTETLKESVKAQEEAKPQAAEAAPPQSKSPFLFYKTAIKNRLPMFQQHRERGIEWAQQQPDVVLIHNEVGEVIDIEEF